MTKYGYIVSMAALILIMGANSVFAQCGLPGTPPCPKKTSLPIKKKTQISKSKPKPAVSIKPEAKGNEISQKASREAKIYFNLANHCKAEDFNCQIINLTKAINLDSKYVDAFYNRGTSYAKKGNFAEAIKDFEQAIRLNPGFADAYQNRAFAYRAQGNFDDALLDLVSIDVPAKALKRLAEDPELKKEQKMSLKKLFASSIEAKKMGIANQEDIKKELEEIRLSIMAVRYDKEKNKAKANVPAFASISKAAVNAYFQKDGNAEKFDKFVKEQIEKAKKTGSLPENYEPPAEQLAQSKDQYAKVRITAEEAKINWSSLGEEFKSKTELQIKLQQTQYLGQKYTSEIIAKKVVATDEEIEQYITKHPEEGKEIETKKAKANEILERARSGEDFAKLAEEFSDDPGSRKRGGLYQDVTQGTMVPEFEKGALALNPGQIADSLIETDFGYHIIKLERKALIKDKDGKEIQNYDVRHILISTMSGSDPSNPMAQPLPLKKRIKETIENENENNLLNKILANNSFEIAEEIKNLTKKIKLKPGRR